VATFAPREAGAVEGRMITAEVLRSRSEVEALAAEWERLFRAGRYQPSLSFEWSRAILCNHLASSSDWFVIVLRCQREIAGVVPMMYVRERLFGVEITTLQPIQELYKTHGDLLFDTSDAELTKTWLESLLKLDLKWDLLRVSRVFEKHPLFVVLAEKRPIDLQMRLRMEQPSYYIELPPTFHEYLASRSGKFRNYLKRAERKSRMLGELTLTSSSDVQSLPAQYEDLLSIERQSWKHSHGTAITAVDHQRGFYRDLTLGALLSGRLYLTFLRIDGKAVAYDLGLICGGCYYYLKTSFIETHRPYGVATVGRARLVERLIADGVTGFDFSGAPYEWEAQWSDSLNWHRSLLVCNKTLRGRLLWLLISSNGYLKRGTDKRSVVFEDPRALRAPDLA
jgi:CelD/BcsL family acetyltransferase involved in cellulose biosynthesis